MSEKGQATIAAVREVAAARPDTVWTGYCAYVVGGKPGCLVGQGLWRAGVIDKHFSKRHVLNGAQIRELQDFLKFDDDEIDWLAKVQVRQDVGDAWGQAVADADQAVTA
jgi:hypothetical protein